MTAGTGEFSIAALSSPGLEFLHLSPANVGQGETLTGAVEGLPFELVFADGQRIKLSLKGSGNEPTSLWHVVESMSKYARLQYGWNSYGGQPLSRKAVTRSFGLLPIILDDQAPEPTVVPTNDGGLQFEWHRRGIDFELTVPPTGPLSYYFADAGTGEEYEGVAVPDRSTIRNVLSRLSQSA
jgi:hypothetical protein